MKSEYFLIFFVGVFTGAIPGILLVIKNLIEIKRLSKTKTNKLIKILERGK